VLVDQSSPNFLFNAEGIVLDNAVYHLSIFLSIPEIFAVKLESCRKKYYILDVFLPSQILRGRCCLKVVNALLPPPTGTSRDKVSWGYRFALHVC